jgi:hypothetical protein
MGVRGEPGCDLGRDSHAARGGAGMEAAIV